MHARELLNNVKISKDLLNMIAQICIELAVDGHRPDIVITKAAKTIATFGERTEVAEEDVQEAMTLALEHRMRRKPFEEMEIDKTRIQELLKNNF